MKKLSKKAKNYYAQIIKELGYSKSYLERLDDCSNIQECEKILEYARIESIDDDFVSRSRKRGYV